jgi:transglutaminase-like putative cysteine protease
MTSVAAILGASFEGLGFAVPLVLSVVLAAALAVVLSARVRRVDVVLAAGLGGGLLYGLLALIPYRWTDGATGTGVVGAYGRAVRSSWAQLLTVALPADATGELLVAPVQLIWIATFVATIVTLRTDAVLAPLPPMVAAYILSLLAVAGARQSQMPLAGGFTLAMLVLAAIRAARLGMAGDLTEVAVTDWAPAEKKIDRALPRRPRRPLPAGARRNVVALPLVAVIAGLAALGAALLPLADGNDRFDLRTHQRRPVTISSALNPLVQVKAQLESNPPTTQFTIRLSSSTGRLPTDRIRLAALGDFDGASWHAGSLFVRSGRVLPARPDPVTTGVTHVKAEIVVSALPGPFLPSLGQPARTGRSDTGFDPESGILVAASAVREGEQYDLWSDVATPDVAELEAAVPMSGQATTPYLRLPPDLPPGLVQLGHRVVAAAATPYARLTALEAYLRDPIRFPYDLSARPGHSYGALYRFLITGDNQNRRGYSEQHATAFTLLARLEGFPTRIAVGYLLDKRTSDRHGGFTVTSRAAHAWPEVALAGIGWVPFEPTDISRLSMTLPPPPPSSGNADNAEQPQLPAPQLVSPIVVPQIDPGGASGAGMHTDTDHTLSLAVLAAIMILIPLMLVVAEKQRRRWFRRHSGSPARRVVGAWREVRDRLTERGLTRSRALTTCEVARRVRQLDDGAAAIDYIDRLASMVNTALFAPTEPAEGDARNAWELASLAGRALNREGRLGRRAVAAIDPRPLLRWRL